MLRVIFLNVVTKSNFAATCSTNDGTRDKLGATTFSIMILSIIGLIATLNITLNIEGSLCQAVVFL
jgi:hypothetical protein